MLIKVIHVCVCVCVGYAQMTCSLDWMHDACSWNDYIETKRVFLMNISVGNYIRYNPHSYYNTIHIIGLNPILSIHILLSQTIFEKLPVIFEYLYYVGILHLVCA